MRVKFSWILALAAGAALALAISQQAAAEPGQGVGGQSGANQTGPNPSGAGQTDAIAKQGGGGLDAPGQGEAAPKRAPHGPMEYEPGCRDRGGKFSQPLIS